MENLNSNSFKPSNISLLAGLVFSIFAIIYSLYNRSIYDFLIYSLIINLGIFSMVAIFYFYAIKQNKPVIKSDRKRNIYFGIYFSLFGPFYYSIGVILNDIPAFKNFINFTANIIIPVTVLVILTIGLILFYFRQYYRFIYGMTEVAIGIIIAINKVKPNNFDFLSSEFYLVILTASLFLVVRGFDNIYQGFTKEPYDLLILKLKKIKTEIEI